MGPFLSVISSINPGGSKNKSSRATLSNDFLYKFVYNLTSENPKVVMRCLNVIFVHVYYTSLLKVINVLKNLQLSLKKESGKYFSLDFHCVIFEYWRNIWVFFHEPGVLAWWSLLDCIEILEWSTILIPEFYRNPWVILE